MKTGWKTVLGLATWAATAALPAVAQTAEAKDSAPRALFSSARSVAEEEPPVGAVVREIDDPQNGNCWLLVRDPSHPGGPGRLVLAVGAGVHSRRGRTAEQKFLAAEHRALTPVIRGGDRLIVEEKTAVVEARLEAVALGPAAAGAPLQVRLAIGGKVVRAVALAPGRASLAPDLEVRP